MLSLHRLEQHLFYNRRFLKSISNSHVSLSLFLIGTETINKYIHSRSSLVPDQNVQSPYPFSDQNVAKPLPSGEAQTYMAYITE